MIQRSNRFDFAQARHGMFIHGGPYTHPACFSCASHCVAVMDRRRSGVSLFQLLAHAWSMSASSLNARLLRSC